MAKRLITRLEDHPNLEGVLGVLAQLAYVGDHELPALADAWTNDPAVAEARSRALSPDSPLVLEVLTAFEAVESLFEEDLAGSAAYVTVDPSITLIALKAVRDAIAAAYAKPILSRSDYAALMEPWLTVFPSSTADEPDLGPYADQVKALLSALPRLAARCHDDEGKRLFEELVERSWFDQGDRDEARDSAFQAAVLTSRRRLWALVRRSGAEGLSRPCYACTAAADQAELDRVLGLCVDAACALLVADAVPDDLIDVLTRPVQTLIPHQRTV